MCVCAHHRGLWSQWTVGSTTRTATECAQLLTSTAYLREQYDRSCMIISCFKTVIHYMVWASITNHACKLPLGLHDIYFKFLFLCLVYTFAAVLLYSSLSAQHFLWHIYMTLEIGAAKQCVLVDNWMHAASDRFSVIFSIIVINFWGLYQRVEWL